ncbi:MAG: zinc ribbon domain-containing protein [Candidatus Chromulinivorax sp.]
MRSVEFQRFIDLVTFDQNLFTIEQDIKQILVQEQNLLMQLEQLEKDFADVKQAKIQARKSVDDKELSMKVLDTKESDLKKKLNTVSSQKEYKSLEKETAVVNAERVRYEQELLQLWNRLEAAEKNYEIQDKVYHQQIHNVQMQIKEQEMKKNELQKQLDDLIAQRFEKQQNIPAQWLDMYINMKGRVSNPVVHVVNDSCDACFYSITPRDLQLLRKNDLLPCRDCYRLLYL